MRLTDLDPRWFAAGGRSGQGLTFLCPHCLSQRLGAAFDRPLDGGSPLLDAAGTPVVASLVAVYESGAEKRGTVIVPPGILWARTGDTFETLTLAPSLDFSRSGHWHGNITNGAIA